MLASSIHFSAYHSLSKHALRSRSLAAIGLGLAHLSQGSAPEAAAAFRGVAAITQATHFSLFRMLAIVGQACAYRLAGSLDPALAMYDQAIAWSTEQAHPSLLAGRVRLTFVEEVNWRGQGGRG